METPLLPRASNTPERVAPAPLAQEIVPPLLLPPPPPEALIVLFTANLRRRQERGHGAISRLEGKAMASQVHKICP